MNTITMGSESLGRVTIQIPCDASKAEQDMIIKNALDGLKFALDFAKENNLNIFS